MPNPVTYVDAPSRPARFGGILSVANVVDVTDPHFAAASGINWSSVGCSFLVDDPGLCFQQNAPSGSITYQGINTETGLIAPFAGYVGVKCFLQPEGTADYDSRARNLLVQGEDRYIESKLAAALEAADASTIAGGSVSEAVGKAEQEADAGYLGLPNLFMSRQAAGAYNGLFGVDVEGDHILSKANRTPIAASGMFPVGKLWITGAVTLYRGPIVVIRAVNQTVNQEMAIAHRTYALGIDCNFISEYSYT